VTTLMALILATAGAGDAGLHLGIRATAQTSFVLFTGAFIASALHRAWPTPLSRWLLANRRYLGVSFAVSHFIHLAFIVALTLTSTEFKLNAATVVVGGGAYMFIAAMTATSFDRTAAWMGPRAWRRLHTIGVYYIWTVFFISYAPRAIRSPAYVPIVLVLLGAITLRLAVGRRSRRHVTSAVGALP